MDQNSKNRENDSRSVFNIHVDFKKEGNDLTEGESSERRSLTSSSGD